MAKKKNAEPPIPDWKRSDINTGMTIVNYQEELARGITKYTPDWVIEGIFNAAAGRPHLLTGWMHAGKSTIATQMGVDVSKGQPFLGRATSRGRVVYWSAESTDAEKDEFIDRIRAQGGDVDSDFTIGFSKAATRAEAYSELYWLIKQASEKDSPYPVRLVIVETAEDFFFPEENDGKEWNRLMRGFSRFMEGFPKICFVILGQFNKTSNANSGNLLLKRIADSGQKVARSNNKLCIETDQERGGVRYIQTFLRNGAEIQPTYLVFDPETKRSSLGEPVATVIKRERKQEGQSKVAKFREEVIEMLSKTPDLYTEQILGKSVTELATKGKTDELRTMVAAGMLSKQRRGKKDHYSVVSASEPSAPVEGFEVTEQDMEGVRQ